MTRTKPNSDTEDRLMKLFNIALNAYHFEKSISVNLKRKDLKGSTMQAQPIITGKSLIRGITQYRISIANNVRGSSKLKVRELPDDVLIGWFAHELGHVKDYRSYTLIGMLLFGLKYIFSSKFRRNAEHRADQLAIEHGFHHEVLATKRFLFEAPEIETNYRLKMQRFYMPLDDVENWIEENISIDPID
jgi:hypothetical protein